jgi:hypothetical protein
MGLQLILFPHLPSLLSMQVLPLMMARPLDLYLGQWTAP